MTNVTRLVSHDRFFVYLYYRRVPKVAAPVTSELAGQRGRHLKSGGRYFPAGSRYFRVAKIRQ